MIRAQTVIFQSFKSLRNFVIWPSSWSILVNVSVLEKNNLFSNGYLQCSVNANLDTFVDSSAPSFCILTDIHLSSVLSIAEQSILKILLLNHFPLNSVHFAFKNVETLLLGTYLGL